MARLRCQEDPEVQSSGSAADARRSVGTSRRNRQAFSLVASLALVLAFGPAAQGRRAVQVSVGDGHACALLDNGSVKCWGRNHVGQLGIGVASGDFSAMGDQPNEMGDNLPAVDLGTNRTAVSVVTGNGNTCALLDNGSVKCWGYGRFGCTGAGNQGFIGNAAGQMGDNLPPVDLGTGRTAKSLVGHSWTLCAVLDNDTLRCWGRNYRGALGLGIAGLDTSNVGDGLNEMGDNLPFAAGVDVGTGRTVLSVAGGQYHNCALLDDQSVKCWGINEHGAAGIGSTQPGIGDEPNEMGDNLPAVILGTGLTATSVFAGYAHACAILNTDVLKCWGLGSSFQLGLGDTNNKGRSVNDMGDNLPPVNLGTNRTAKDVALGCESSCAVLDNGKIKCWGRSDLGQLGLGDTTPRGTSGSSMGDSLPFVDLGNHKAISVSVRMFSVCALLDSGRIKCWGKNDNGELALGDIANRGDNPDEMGDFLPYVDLGPFCGDGLVEGSEECDDGNDSSLDGCSSTCTNEMVYADCSPNPCTLGLFTTCEDGSVYVQGDHVCHTARRGKPGQSLKGIPRWGMLPEFQHCTLNKEWPEVRNLPGVGIGGMGKLAEKDAFEVYACLSGTVEVPHECTTAAESFCFVYDEVNRVFVPWRRMKV